jgi:hypothetical protein
MGANLLADAATLRVWAPGAEKVCVIGGFNAWAPNDPWLLQTRPGGLGSFQKNHFFLLDSPFVRILPPFTAVSITLFMAEQWMASFPAPCFQITWPHPDDAFRKTSVGGFKLCS